MPKSNFVRFCGKFKLGNIVQEERREHPRRAAILNANLVVESSGTFPELECQVETIDISWGGLSVRLKNDKQSIAFEPGRAFVLRGQKVRLVMSDSGVALWGDVVRVDPATLLMAVSISKVSHVDFWRSLCEDGLVERQVV